MTDAADRKTPPAADPLIGATLAGYRIESRIGRGGYADVYRAVQTRLAREVALKVLREDGTGVAPEQVEDFLREARAAAALSHACLVQVHDVGESEGRHFLSMELLRGGNLAHRIKTKGPLPWRDAVLIAMDVADALQHAHEHGILHHDVKPANILLNRAGEAKLADLGLSTTDGNAGTRAFMAPERILRRPVDARSDLYSLGCTIHAMITGTVPFDYPTSKQMLAAHVNEAPPTMRSRGYEVPDVLEDLVTRLLAKDPAQRPESAAKTAELLDWVEEVGAAGGVGDPATPAAPPAGGAEGVPMAAPRRRSRRRQPRSSDTPWGLILGLLLLGAVIVGALWAWRQFR